jgi:hypothetical protein
MKLKNNTINHFTNTAILNIFLITTTIFLLFYFVIVSNIITSSNYKIKLLNDELSKLTETNSLLTSKKLSIEDSLILMDFVKENNMVEADFITHIFENGNVAALRYKSY